ncbi:hypothetical protein [Nocardia sp. NPDC004860]|uniref:hypothetical protein n=1 Tax=Nocardia sp. NPDC004860 TaxID=3154557 RepID=UPI0033B7868E
MYDVLARLGMSGAAMTGPEVSHVVALYDAALVREAELDSDSEGWDEHLQRVVHGPERLHLHDALSMLLAEMPEPGPQAARMRYVRDPDPGRELGTWLDMRVAQVNSMSSQARLISAFGSGMAPGGEDGARAHYLAWVDPVLVVSTPDHEQWGRFDRAEAWRRSLAWFCVLLYEAAAADRLDEWIDTFMTGHFQKPVRLERVEGPAGPIFAVEGDGTHRAHFARVFGLPLLARIQTSPLPRPLLAVDRPPSSYGTSGPGCASLWRGLRALGLLDAIEESDAMLWTPTSICAEWMLLAPEMATAANRVYDQTYPEALREATGLGNAQLFDAEQWADTMLAWTRSP